MSSHRDEYVNFTARHKTPSSKSVYQCQETYTKIINSGTVEFKHSRLTSETNTSSMQSDWY